MSEYAMDPGAHWGEILDFWKEVDSILREGGPDLEEYPGVEISDLEIWRQPWARTPVAFRASPVLQRLAMGTFAYALDADIPAVKLQAEARLRVLTRLMAQRLKQELESFYVRNPKVTRLGPGAESYICSGWMVRYLQVGYVGSQKQ